MNYFTRRAFMKTLGAFGAAAPFYHLLECSIAEAQTPPPLRLITMFSPHGAMSEYWKPQGTAAAVKPGYKEYTDFKIDYADCSLAPLLPFKDRLLIPTGVDIKVAYDTSLYNDDFSEHTGHSYGSVSVFTGSPSIAAGKTSSPSIEVALGKRFGKPAHPSLQLGVCSSDFFPFNALSFDDAGNFIDQNDYPDKVYLDLFPASFHPGDPVAAAAAARRVSQRRSIIDTVLADLNRLRARLAAPELQKIDQHLDALRTIEQGLELSVPKNCSKPAAPADTKSVYDNLKNMKTTGELQISLIAEILACDLSRFISLSWGYSGSYEKLADLVGDQSITGNCHDDAHECRSDAKAGKKIALMNKFYAGQLAGLMDKLANKTEGNGTVLDNTIILWGNELGGRGGGQTHNNLDHPFVIAGGCGGKFRMGRWLSFDPDADTGSDAYTLSTQTAHNGILVGIAKAFDPAVETFGSTKYTGALPGMMAIP